MTWLIAPLFGLPRYVWMIAAIVAGVVGFTLWLAGEKREAVAAAAAVASAVAITRARKADESAQRAARGKSDAVEAENRAARDAASDSDDPLKAGLDKLREKK